MSKSLAGHFLVASADLSDPNFFRTVVLIFRHNEEGAAGLVLNRRTNASVRQLWEQIGESPCKSRAPLHLGGPVEGPLMAIHALEQLQELEIVPGVFLSNGREMLERLVDDDDARTRFFVGYAGWGDGQLERELGEGSWLVAPATAELVFGDHEELWQKVTRQVTSGNLLSALKIKHVPPDPRLN